MGSPALNETFVPRNHLQRTLAYWPHVRWSYYFGMALASIVTLVALLGWLTAPPMSAAAFFTLILWQSPIPLLTFAVPWFLLRPLAFTKVKVFADHLEIERLGRHITIPFSNIERVRFSHVSNLGGWFQLQTTQGKFRFTVVLERSEYILESLASFNPHLIPIKDLEDYRRTALVCDHNWAHLYEHVRTSFRDRPALMRKFAFFPAAGTLLLATARAFRSHPFRFDQLLLVFGLFVAAKVALLVLSWWVSSVVQIHRTRKSLKERPNFLRRDIIFEKRMAFIGQRIQQGLFMLLVLGSLALVLL